MSKANKKSKRITVTIDGQQIETEPGRNLVQVANENGIFIPSLCYFENIEPPLGTCRVCTCKIDGVAGPACTETVRDGMVVDATTDELADARKAGDADLEAEIQARIAEIEAQS